MKTVYGWAEAFAAGVATCGGKGYNLARMSRYGFPVPAGFVIAADAYRAALAPHASLLARAGTLDHESAEAESTFEEFRQALLDAPVREELRAGVLDALRAAGIDGAAVAVRSSGVAEDGSSASFAGMHQSFLNVSEGEAILDAMRGCWASLWTPHAVTYRRKMQVSDDEAACAVVVCRMVSAEDADEPLCAGVAFTADPQSGRRNVVVIDLARGSGENVVSGRVNPERLVFRIDQGGVIVRESCTAGAERLLSPERQRELALLSWRIHWSLGEGQFPQDIEWAFDGRKLAILQARPVTRLPYFTFRGGENLPVIWSTANMKDAVPGVYSMFGWSLLRATVDRVLYANLTAAGADVPHGIDTVKRFDGRGYFDLTAVEWSLYDILGILPHEVNRSMGGHQPEIDIPSATPLKGPDASRRKRAQFALLRTMLGVRRTFERVMARYEPLMANLMRRDYDSMSNAQILASLDEMLVIHEELDPLVGLTNTSAGPLLSAVEKLVQSIAGPGGSGLAARLLTGFGAITSADHGYRLNDLANLARSEPAAGDWLRSGKAADSWRELPNDSPFRKAFAAYLAEFGHRAVYEGDVMNVRWAEDPAYLVEQMRSFLDQPPRDLRATARAINERAWKELNAITLLKRPLVRWLVRRARNAMALREAAKSALVASVPPTRRISLAVGRRLVAAGHLDHAEDIFHLSITDFRVYLEGVWDGAGARELAADNATQRERWLAMPEPPDVVIEGETVRRRTEARAAEAGGMLEWGGIGASGGLATGTARVIRHPHEAARLNSGDVLVAPSTDPGWTPLFLRASAVVMETGGYLSHGAVVAREYGIPAVVNVPGVLTSLRDGTQIEVDGERGRVRVTG